MAMHSPLNDSFSPVVTVSPSSDLEDSTAIQPAPSNALSLNASISDANETPVRRRNDSPSAPEQQLEITPYPGPESDDEVGPPCPTCKGRGDVDKDDEEGTIALIPVKDKRLKPRKTKLYIFIAVFLSLLVSALLVFFLFERTVSVEIAGADVIRYNYVSTPPLVQMTVVIKMSVDNQNYFAVTMKNLTVFMTAPEDVGMCIYGGSDADDGSFSADALSTTYIQCTTVISFKGERARLIRDACERSLAWNHFIMLLNTNVKFSYLIFDHSILENFDWDCFTCRNGNFPPDQPKHSCLSDKPQNHTTVPHPVLPTPPVSLP